MSTLPDKLSKTHWEDRHRRDLAALVELTGKTAAEIEVDLSTPDAHARAEPTVVDMTETAGYWHNEATGAWDYRTTPTADDEMVQYIPQSEAAQGLYKCHRQMGKSVLEAAGRVLATATGEKWPEA